MVLYQPRRAVISTFLANLMQADFADGSTAITIFGLSPFLAKALAEKPSCGIIRPFRRQKQSSSVMTNLNMSELHDSRWQCMIIRVQTRVIVKTIIVYRQLPFEWGFSFKLHKSQFDRNYLNLAKFFYEITSYSTITIEFMFAGINMFWARLRLILARAARRGLKWVWEDY